MPLLSLSELRSGTAGPNNLSKSHRQPVFVNEALARAEIERSFTKSLATNRHFDVFLSHRHLDATDVLEAKRLLENYYDLDVFVDSLESGLEDVSQVTSHTAQLLREAMNRSSCLILASTENAHRSLWIPWEIGYCDALHGKVVILPFTNQPTDRRNYKDREYLGLYPFIRKSKSVSGEWNLYVASSSSKSNSQRLDKWINDLPSHEALLRG